MIKIIISVIVITLAILGITFYNINFKDQKPKDNSTNEITTNITSINENEEENNNFIIKVTIMLYDINKNVIVNDNLEGNNKTLYELLNENYNIRCEDTIHGKIILDFETVKTDFKTKYIAIYVNGKYSSKGLSYIALEDGITIEFKETNL